MCMMQSNYLYLTHVIDYIEKHMKSKITVDDIAYHINLSKYHLHRIITSAIGRPLFKKEFGMTPNAYRRDKSRLKL